MGDLDGRFAFVTGAGSGLGRAIALAFAGAGARVAVNDLRKDGVAETARALGAALACEPLVGDVADSHAVAGWFGTLTRATGDRLDVLVNNAGYADADPETMARLAAQMEELTTTGRVTTALDATQRMTDERWTRMLAVHLNGTFFCTREALKLMSPHRSGRIINMASIAGLTGIASVPHYSAAKAAIIGFTRGARAQVGAQGILKRTRSRRATSTPHPRRTRRATRRADEGSSPRRRSSAVSARRARDRRHRPLPRGPGRDVLHRPGAVAERRARRIAAASHGSRWGRKVRRWWIARAG
jgi:3-oxoacyl-[acyl-carrier protein] reductase